MQKNYFPCMTVLYHNASQNTSFSGTIIKYNLTRRHLTKLGNRQPHYPPTHRNSGKESRGPIHWVPHKRYSFLKNTPGVVAFSTPPTPIYFVPQSYPTLPVQKPPRHHFKKQTPHPHIFSVIVRPFLLLKCP